MNIFRISPLTFVYGDTRLACIEGGDFTTLDASVPVQDFVSRTSGGVYPVSSFPYHEVSIPDQQAPEALTGLQFMDLFTDVELGAIFDAARTSGMVEAWLKRLDVAGGSVHLESPVTIRGIGSLVTAGLLTSDRAAAILSNTPHS